MSDSQPLGELGAFRRGRGGTKADEASSGIPCIRYGDLYTQHDCVIRNFTSFIDRRAVHKYTPLRKGDIMFAASGELHEDIGKAAVFLGDEEAYTGGDTIVFHPSHGVDPLFLGYAVNSEQAARFKAKSGQGSSVIHIKSSNLKELRVFLPPLPEQRRIAEILDTVDEAIQRTEELIAKLEEMKKGLLHDLLTRGIDENGELRDPERHPEQFKDSPLGRIPMGWRISQLSEAVPSVDYGVSVPLHDTGEIPVLRMMNLVNGEVDLSDLRYSDAPKARGLTLQSGDVLFNRTNSLPHVGRTGIWRGDERLSFASYLVRLNPDPDALEPEWLNRWLNWEITQRRIRKWATPGVHQVNINPTNLRRTPLALPPVSEQRASAELLLRFDEKGRLERLGLQKLRSLRQALMNDLLTGRVRVSVPEPEEATA